MFNTVQEAFNHYRNASLEDIETRAGEIRGTIENDPEADVTKLNIEIEGLNQAKENIKEKEQEQVENRSYNPITGQQFKQNNEVQNNNVFGTEEYRSAFFKKMLGQELSDVEQRSFNHAMDIQKSEHRADEFTSSSNASAVIPEQTLNEVIRRARTQGGLLANVRSFNMPTKIRIPISTPQERAEWHTEGAKVEADKVVTTAVSFEANEIIKIFSISVKAKTMSISAFESYLVEELTNCVVEAIEYALINGTGNNQGQGILTGITWNDENSLELTGKYTDFTKALGMLKRGYAQNAKFAMSNATLYNTVYGVQDGNKRPIFVQDAQRENVGYIFGKPVIIDDNIEDGTIILGDFNYIGYNLPQGIMLESSRESSFRSGLIDYRAMAVADTRVLVDDAFVKLTSASSDVGA
ncbi:TPA: phage major capsid protein [Staphylococcus pseudintermedius]|uniref:phage major capsid protein n=1 Tax=Staphylococcus pseudintermedius TaxID=283734 RepID=UPI00101EDABD|nr:phage major capsid protein [Staphylococcus pseudintermedius]EGQ0331709.1 phage major capsid protein [Staphylococcus pseudintermedius]EGQ2803270.1 phage major capsid protein [Staphylococcus pseudintermedius]EGQ3165034.1 phage major capsid protein [Staphylococcus pseudintermedius]EGQ3687445.1 phage major capsid protein [Staphylococcus pseudintermedius]EGQ4240345.1 phage major capsid protein [Staphylococcus pseudintermedius]